jgi:acid phosphatase (class B)
MSLPGKLVISFQKPTMKSKLSAYLRVWLVMAGTSSVVLAEIPSVPAPAASALVERRTLAAPSFSEPVASEVTVEQLKRLLPPPPIVVGFDVDDTLVFSAPAFEPLQKEYPAEIIRPKNYNALTAEQKAKYHEFWNRLNNEYDDRSTAKRIGGVLLRLHLERGDDVFIISKRQSSKPENDLPTRRIERLFQVRLPHPVVQTELKDKTPFIAERHIQYYYGDSDSDITAAIAGGATPIRVKRSPETYAADKVHNGWYGEIVITGSDW